MSRASTLQISGALEGALDAKNVFAQISRGYIALFSQLGILHLSLCQFLICTAEIMALPHPIGILQTELYEYSPLD